MFIIKSISYVAISCLRCKYEYPNTLLSEMTHLNALACYQILSQEQPSKHYRSTIHFTGVYRNHWGHID